MNSQAILQLIEKVDALERKMRNLIRPGHIKSINGRKVIVDFDRESDDDYETPLIPWVPIMAGEVLNWRAPTVGEQVIVINLSGGSDEANCVALPALYCNEFLPDDTDPTKTYTTFNDVFRVETDAEGNHALKANGSVKLESGGEFIIVAGTSLSVKAKSTAQYKSNGDTEITGKNIHLNK